MDGHESTAQLLLNNGADVNLCTKEGVGPLRFACQAGYKRIMQIILDNVAKKN